MPNAHISERALIAFVAATPSHILLKDITLSYFKGFALGGVLR